MALEGVMGAGKTQFSKGVAAGLGVKGVVNSPTYTIVKEYEGSRIGELTGSTDSRVAEITVNLHHFDLWRLDSFNPNDFDMESLWRPGRVLVMEWAAPALPYLKALSDQAVVYAVYVEVDTNNERRIYGKRLA